MKRGVHKVEQGVEELAHKVRICTALAVLVCPLLLWGALGRGASESMTHGCVRLPGITVCPPSAALTRIPTPLRHDTM